jgi:hypothetical protein
MANKSDIPRYKMSSVADLIPYARNSRTHSDEQIGKIDEMGAGMYKGQHKRVTKAKSGDQLDSGGAVPTHTLQSIGDA